MYAGSNRQMTGYPAGEKHNERKGAVRQKVG